MEVGAVKQAFNNEVIQLKKNLNQARIQIIHKLTRKAKTFAEKKTSEKLKEKLKRKAASAVNEVLILKKIKPRDVARFTVTHTGNLQDYLNKPIVDQDKACARLLLHKSLQQKYTIIRNTFSGIPIKDLLMSRNERLKLKREARLDQKMKRDKKKKVVNAEGEWDVENINTSKTKDVKKNTNTSKTKDVKKSTSKKFDANEASESADDEEIEFDEQVDSGDEANSNDDEATSDVENAGSDDHNDEEDEREEDQSDGSEAEAIMETDQESSDNEERSDNEELKQTDNENEEESDNEEKECVKGKHSKLVKPSPDKADIKEIKNVSSAITFDQLGKNRRKPEIKNPNKPKDIQKNKNLKEKLQSRKFNKDSNDSEIKDNKTADPFFITATGENYMSVAEPRQPDEVKEIHKQGNRQERRAAMFGNIPKVKPRQNYRENNSRQNDSSGYRHKNQSDNGSYNRGNDGFRNRNDSQFKGKNDKFRSQNDRSFEGRDNQFKGRNDKPFEGKNNRFKGGNDRSVEGRNDRFKDRNDSNFKGRNNDSGKPKVEKLHPSWEAKKKQSGIIPFQGKKIVFDEG